jgi:outer membrane protein assembly factor BamD (BamD/ComL family)
MSITRPLFICLIGLLGSTAFGSLSAQMGFNLEVKKPKPYEERVLKAEKTPTDKKIKPTKRFFQNLTTHYNYYFNANNKLNEVIERAKAGHKDDYSQLLPFYNYSLDATAGDQQELDSVIYKAQTGLVMHDLRSDWADNMYLLWGAAYYFQKKFDSASLMFQFINYAFAEKEKDGYYKYIGSRMDGNNALSISTKEDNSLVKKVFSTAPSRNDALLWRARSMIAGDNLDEAGTLIATLKNDPGFPERLHDELEEVQAFWFYKNRIWDSSAVHLLNALDVAQNKQEKARWEYLAAQLFEKKGNIEEARNWYSKSIGHGTDPILDVYARLNLVRLNKEGGENYIDQNIAELLRMAKRDRFADYRDIIYYMAAQMEIDRGNFAAAQDLLLKASKYNNGNLASRSNAFLMIADMAYNQKNYVTAASFYDSILTNELKEEELKRVESRKPSLAKLVKDLAVVSRQDSLQRIAMLPENERKDLITKLAKKLRKQQGLSEENAGAYSSNNLPLLSPNAPPVDLFNTDTKGEWYFYNNGLRTGGTAQFKQVWGNRPNTDNWRRFSQVSNQLLAKVPAGATPTTSPQGEPTVPVDNTPSFETLVKNVPLTPEALKVSNDSIKNSLFNLGNTYLNEIEDYASAIEAFERLRNLDASFPRMDEVVFGLYYAYAKTGNAGKAAEMKNLLSTKFAGSRFTSIVTSGKDPNAKSAVSPQSTKDYEAVYDLFLEGHFEEAEAAKKRADSLYQTNFWQPQLLYIEAVYHIRQRDDSTAKSILNTLIAQNPNTPLGAKAKNLFDVVSRRQQIEDELNRLNIQRPVEDTAKVVLQPVIKPAEPQYQMAQRDTALAKKQDQGIIKTVPQRPADTLAQKPIVVKKKQNTVYQFEPSFTHFAVIVLEKVDGIFSGEAKNAFTRYNKENYYNQDLPVSVVDLDSVHKLMLVGSFDNAQKAIDYIQKARKLAPNEIVPWLKPEKYSFSIISSNNLEVLQTLKDLNQYRKFLEQNLPGKL